MCVLVDLSNDSPCDAKKLQARSYELQLVVVISRLRRRRRTRVLILMWVSMSFVQFVTDTCMDLPSVSDVLHRPYVDLMGFAQIS